MSKQKPEPQEPKRQNRARAAGEIVSDIAGVSFKRFGFVQGAIVSRWKEIVGERYARVSTPESIRFPAGRKSGGTLTLLVEGAHAPLLQHLAPTIMERVNRFFGYEAVCKVAFRRGTGPKREPRPVRPEPVAVPQELGDGLRAIADPGLRACLESLASSLAATKGPPRIERGPILPNPINRPE